MYETALTLHSVVRMALTLAAALLFLRGLSGWVSGKPQGPLDRVYLLVATIAADLQLVIGLLLYFVWSPTTTKTIHDMGSAMKDPTERFWADEHGSAMLLAIVLVHVGKILARRASTDRSKQMRTCLFFGLVLLLILTMSAWPFSSVARPCLRL